MKIATGKKPNTAFWRLGVVLLLTVAFALSAVATRSGYAADVDMPRVGPMAVDTFSNSTPITWPENVGEGVLSPSEIVVSGLVGNITKVTVTLHGVSHTRPDDFDILLQGPSGTGGVLIWSDACGGETIANLTVTFDDDAAAALPDTTNATTGPCVSGTYKPSNYDGSGTATVANEDQPNGVVANATTLAAFVGTNPNGTWRLYTLDDRSGSIGSIGGGWSITITTPDVTETPTATETPTETPTVTETPTETPTVTETPTETPTEEPTATETPTVTETPTEIPTEEPTAEPTEGPAPVPAAHYAMEPAELCADLSGATSPIVRGSVSPEAVPNGNVYCRVLAEDGVFPNPLDTARLGDPGLIEYGVIHAVDVFGVTSGGMSYPAFDVPVTICLQGTGRFIYLNALNSPRTTFEMPAVVQGGYTCASIPAAGTVVLIPALP